MTKNFLIIFIVLISISCGSSPTNTITTTGPTITIISLSFFPVTIAADPGDTIFFFNDDNVPHQILSQSAPDAFDDTGEFDSLIISEGDIRFITVPATAASGSTLFFYDSLLEDTMLTPNGTITVN